MSSNYLVKAVGIDLAPKSSGISAINYRVGTWECFPIEAGVLHLTPLDNGRHAKFLQQLAAARHAIRFIEKHKPDIVGIEDYTMQNASHVAFDMGQVGGIMRTLLWQEGYRQLLIFPGRITKLVKTAHGNGIMRATRNSKSRSTVTTAKRKADVVAWVKKNMGAEFTAANKKEESDMADATVYALIAACFFSMYWLEEIPPMLLHQLEIFYNRAPHKNSALAKSGWKPSGLMDTPYRFLIRNPLKEADTYTPEWMKGTVKPEIKFIGSGAY